MFTCCLCLLVVVVELSKCLNCILLEYKFLCYERFMQKPFRQNASCNRC